MTAALPGLGPPACLRLDEPCWGIDTSTVRMSCAALLPLSEEQEIERDVEAVCGQGLGGVGPRLVWDTLSLPKAATIAFRQSLAVREMIPWLGGLRDQWGKPGTIGIEAPLAGGNTPLPSFYVVGALYVAIGSVFGVEVEVIEFNPGEHKKLATGHGYCPGLPRAMPKGQKRQREKERMTAWARGVGYGGWLDDEAEAVSVATATGIRVEQRTRAD